MACANCRYWEVFDADLGRCCRRPPTIIGALFTDQKQDGEDWRGAIEMATQFPITSGDQWCGEFVDGGIGKD